MSLVYPLAWPLDSRGKQLQPAQIDLHLSNLSRSGGVSLSGVEQVVSSPSARWEGRIMLPAMDSATVLAWRGFVSALRGRAGTFLCPAFERGRAPWPVDAWGRVQTPSVARAPLLANTAYAVDPARDPHITVTAAAAAQGATALVLTVASGGIIRAGHRFSIGQRLYEVSQSIAAGANVYNVDISPRLRLAASVGQACEFIAPVSLMRFASDLDGRLDLQANVIAHPEINIVEAF